MDKAKQFGFLLKDVSRRYVSRFEQLASEISLTLLQCRVLVNLHKSEGISQAKLGELTDTDSMMMVRILDRMEADQLLERRPDPADRRARRLYLTKKAKPLLDEVWRLADTTRAEVFAGVGKADRDVFMRVLESIHENVCALEQAPAIWTASPNSKTRAKPKRAARSATSK
ncbi:MAG TPA: MarR family transcriptional regulator [Steroidobacteraceae bacterium]|nr:MarR family transcriptional regulator [Steroidobacteraceae bacterium]